MAVKLTGQRVAVMVENNYQELEVWYPIYRFQEAGAAVSIVGPNTEKYLSKLGYAAVADTAAKDAVKKLYDVLIIPGGYAPDLMRLDKDMVELVRQHANKGKVVAAICHGSWLLASADVIKGRNVTGAPSIKDDLRNAGGVYQDQEAVRDGNIVTSRKPADIPAFCNAIFEVIASTARHAA